MLWSFVKRMLHFSQPTQTDSPRLSDEVHAPPLSPTPHVLVKVEEGAPAPANTHDPLLAPAEEPLAPAATEHVAPSPQTEASATDATRSNGPMPTGASPTKGSSTYTSRQYVIGGLTFEVDSRYAIKAVIGKGAYGLVCSADDNLACNNPSPSSDTSEDVSRNQMLAPHCKVAVKKIIDPFHDHTDSKRLLREIKLLRSLRHPNVLHLLDLMPPPTLSPDNWRDVYLVTRLFDTNLHRVIYSGQPLTDPHVQYILWQLFRALRYLHKGGVIHRDMKPTNLLLNRDCELALADFGLARFMPGLSERRGGGLPIGEEQPSGKAGQLTKYVVTRWYRAPELLVQNKRYDAKVDMWSVGCILAEVIGAKAIFPGKDSLHQLRLVVETMGTPSTEELAVIENDQAVNYIKGIKHKEASNSFPSSPQPKRTLQRLTSLYPKAEPSLLELISLLLQFDPAKRPTAAEALDHPYLTAYRDAPEEDFPTPEIDMAFEATNPTKETLRQLVFEEVLRYHPELRP
ncbi:MAG: hypothetical protein SGPRY_010838, partial [Prymnesium sp.]